jgi:3-mercaptopyruvate sulfurtransferase SseA
VALLLQKHGRRAAVLVGGYQAWRDAGLPLTPLQRPREPSQAAGN